VVTNLDDDPMKIIKINEGRWEIGECFRIMKTEFEARPVYLQREFGFQTDYEYITRSKMRSIIKTTKEVTASSQRKFQKIAKRKKI
jgi:hypothetical protein